MNLQRIVRSLALLVLACNLRAAAPLGTAFTYQGRLTDGGVLANGQYDFWFKLYTDPITGTQVGSTASFTALPVSNGLFTVTLDFGAFTGEARWLDISMHNSTNDPAVGWVWLSPRQQITPAPCATYSSNAGLAATAAVAGTASNVVAGGISAPAIAAGQVVKSLNGLRDAIALVAGTNVTITPAGNSLQISASGPPAWSLAGNSVGPGQFLGSLNNQPVEFMANGARALRLEPTWMAPNLIGGDQNNSASGVMGAVIGGGGNSATPNVVTGHYGVVGGGAGNSAGTSAFVGGGGGSTANGQNSVIGGGQWNTASAHVASVGGGINNQVSAEFATIGGGVNNLASGGAATVPGGNGNEASGTNSFAAGSAAHALHDGAFVWGDGTYPVTSTGQNQFIVQASGGVQFQSVTGPMLTLSPSGDLRVAGSVGVMAGPLQLMVNGGMPVERFDFSLSAFSPNITAGSMFNLIPSTSSGSVIAGGGGGSGIDDMNIITGDLSAIGGGMGNTITRSDYSDIPGGWQNSIGSGHWAAVIAGGRQNTINASSTLNGDGESIGGGVNNGLGDQDWGATIAGGWGNQIQSGAPYASILGGEFITNSASYASMSGGHQNLIAAYANAATIGGGSSNVINLSNICATIAGGNMNKIGNLASYSTIAGGVGNIIQAGAVSSAIGGGSGNAAAGACATVPGGANNEANGFYSFAAGYRAKADHGGSFVWADASANWDFRSITNNIFQARASGGVRFYSDAGGNFGVNLAPGSGAWTSMSDRNAKENLQPVSARAMLEKVAALPLCTWNYKSQDTSIRHIGPMAQDFKAAFQVGESDTGITVVDADGVALAAIQGLNLKVDEQRLVLQAKEAKIAALERRLAALEQSLKDLSR